MLRPRRLPLDRIAVLDAGSGTGSYLQALLAYVGRIEAVDLNPGMLEVAARKLAGSRAEGGCFLRREDRRASLRRLCARRNHDQPGAAPPAG